MNTIPVSCNGIWKWKLKKMGLYQKGIFERSFRSAPNIFTYIIKISSKSGHTRTCIIHNGSVRIWRARKSKFCFQALYSLWTVFYHFSFNAANECAMQQEIFEWVFRSTLPVFTLIIFSIKIWCIYEYDIVFVMN